MKSGNVKIILKCDDKSTREKEYLLLSGVKNPEKVFAKLVKMWKKEKSVTIPYHKCAVASDLIHTIIVY